MPFFPFLNHLPFSTSTLPLPFHQYAERLAARISEQRDRAEEERMKELRKKLELEKEEALQRQWEECERLKEIAVEEACTALHKRLRNEFAIEKEQAIAEALRKARVSEWVN